MSTILTFVVFYTSFEIHLCVAMYSYNILNNIDGSLQIPCDTSQQCDEFGNFQCVNNICTCVNDTACRTPSTNMVFTRIGESCTDTSQCDIQKSYCNKQTHKCDCARGSASSEDGRKCLNLSGSFGSMCEENIQCSLLNGICKERKCSCTDNMHLNKGTCFKNVGLGLTCQRNEECSVTDFSSCIGDKCTCNEQYVKSELHSKCLSKSLYLMSACSEDIQCTSNLGSGSVCSNGFCTCMELYQYKVKIQKCVLDARLDDTCGNHTDCHQPGSGESRLECVLGVCKCKPAYFEDKGSCILSYAQGRIFFRLSDLLPHIISFLIVYVIV